MKTLSLKLDDPIYAEAEEITLHLKIARNRYINEAVNLYNIYQKRRILKNQLSQESNLVSENSLEILKILMTHVVLTKSPYKITWSLFKLKIWAKIIVTTLDSNKSIKYKFIRSINSTYSRNYNIIKIKSNIFIIFRNKTNRKIRIIRNITTKLNNIFSFYYTVYI